MVINEVRNSRQCSGLTANLVVNTLLWFKVVGYSFNRRFVNIAIRLWLWHGQTQSIENVTHIFAHVMQANSIAFFLGASSMSIAANRLFRRFWYFSKLVGTVSLGWRSNSGKVGRFIAIVTGFSIIAHWWIYLHFRNLFIHFKCSCVLPIPPS